MPKNDYTVKFRVGDVTFTPAPADTTCAVMPSGYYYGVRPCGKPAVTSPSNQAHNRYANRYVCKQHAAVAARSAANDLKRREEYRARVEASNRREARREAAVKRLAGRGLKVPTYGAWDLTDLADQLDSLYPQEG